MTTYTQSQGVPYGQQPPPPPPVYGQQPPPPMYSQPQPPMYTQPMQPTIMVTQPAAPIYVGGCPTCQVRLASCASRESLEARGLHKSSRIGVTDKRAICLLACDRQACCRRSSRCADSSGPFAASQSASSAATFCARSAAPTADPRSARHANSSTDVGKAAGQQSLRRTISDNRPASIKSSQESANQTIKGSGGALEAQVTLLRRPHSLCESHAYLDGYDLRTQCCRDAFARL